MIAINFFPDSDNKDFETAAEGYRRLWSGEGNQIVETLQNHSGFLFREKYLNALVFDGRSHSHPLSLRYDLDPDRKRSTLVHELGHRLLYKRGRDAADSSQRHCFLFLILYDVYIELYSEPFACDTVAWDSGLGTLYKEAWEWALGFDKQERRNQFNSLKL